MSGSDWTSQPSRELKAFLRNRRHGGLAKEDGFVCCHHRVFPEFTLKAASAESHMAFDQEWTRGELRTDDNYPGWYELRYHQTVLRQVHYVGFDNRKKSMGCSRLGSRSARGASTSTRPTV